MIRGPGADGAVVVGGWVVVGAGLLADDDDDALDDVDDALDDEEPGPVVTPSTGHVVGFSGLSHHSSVTAVARGTWRVKVLVVLAP